MTSETPTFGRYAEIPYDQMTSEQKDAYDGIIEARGRAKKQLFETPNAPAHRRPS